MMRHIMRDDEVDLKICRHVIVEDMDVLLLLTYSIKLPVV